jgi:hypothetical protein
MICDYSISIGWRSGNGIALDGQGVEYQPSQYTSPTRGSDASLNVISESDLSAVLGIST